MPVVDPSEPTEDCPQSPLDEALAEARAMGRNEATEFIFAMLLADGLKPEVIGAKVHVWAFASGLHPNNPRTQAELASAMNVSEGTITNLKKKFSKSSNALASFLKSRKK